MNKYGGGLLLLLAAIVFCCGCTGGDSIFSGGNSQTFGSEIPDERSVGMTLDEVLADFSMSQNEEMFSFRNQTFLAGRGTGMTEDGRASSWAFFVRPEYENRTVVLIHTDRGWSEYEWEQDVDYQPVDMSALLSPDEVFALQKEMIPDYFGTKGAEVDTFLANGTYMVTIFGLSLYEPFRFDAYTGEWMK